MPAESLTFSCPHCQTRLTVKLALAGISGPCPNCRGIITAPPAPEEEAPAPREESAATTEPAVISPLSVRSGEAAPESEVPAPDVSGDPPAPDSPRIRPEPRSLPDRPQIIPLPVRRSTMDQQLRSTGHGGIIEAGRRPFRLANILLPAAFVTLAAAIVGTLVYFYAPGSPGQLLKGAGKPLVVQYPPKGTPPAPRTSPPQQQPNGPPGETAAEPSPDHPVPDRPGSPAIEANEMIEAFLRAKDAASRAAHVEPSATEAELAATLLGRELPEITRIESELPLDHPEEQMTEFPYRVTFYSEDSPATEFGVLVRKRGSQPPRVFLPAFLDLVGGRLAAFTAKPNSLPPARFHVYLEPIDDCFETEVPGHDRKFTLKLMAGPAGKETARAYVANASRLRQLVENPDYPIRWGMRRRATVTVQWNHREDPARPYLELLEINAPDWNL